MRANPVDRFFFYTISQVRFQSYYNVDKLSHKNPDSINNITHITYSVIVLHCII